MFVEEVGGYAYEVTSGWDRTYQTLFLIVDKSPGTPRNWETLSDEDYRKGAEFSNANTESLFSGSDVPRRSTSEIESVLNSLNIPMPQNFLAAIDNDKLTNAGVKTCLYGS